MAIAELNLDEINGANGFVINGIDPMDRSGTAVSNAGDINGDGIDDIIIGADFAESGTQTATGESYVIFGRIGGFGESLDLSTLDGNNGFRLDGIRNGDFSGNAVSGAGDVNGDGFDDFIIGAPFASPNERNLSGESYIVFGKSKPFSPVFNLSDLNGSNGFRISGARPFDRSGARVSSAGDINGDGIDDIVIAAPSGFVA